MKKEVIEKIGRFLGLIVNLGIAVVLIAYTSGLLSTKGVISYTNDALGSILLLISTYPAWQWRAKPIQFFIWCCKSFYQKL